MRTRLALSVTCALASICAPVGAATFVDAPYAAEVRSVRATANSAVHAEPSASSTRIGVIGKGARAQVRRATPPGAGCAKRWIAIAPRGWVCELSLEPSPDEATAATAVSLHDDAEPELGVYGVVRASTAVFANRGEIAAGQGHELDSAASVRMLGRIAVGGVRYWVTASGLIAERAIGQMSPSTFHGAPIDDGILRVVWAHHAHEPRAAVQLRSAPRADAEITGEVSPRARLAVREVSSDGRWIRVSDSDWAARADVRIAHLAAPPPGTSDTERWFDVDLDEQILVAYEGARPVYATLVSTGKWDRRTPETVARLASGRHDEHEARRLLGRRCPVDDVLRQQLRAAHVVLARRFRRRAQSRLRQPRAA